MSDAPPGSLPPAAALSGDRTVGAARLHEVGQPLRIERAPLRASSPDEVVVELSHAAVNVSDLLSQQGRLGGDAARPRTLGREGSGYLDGRKVLVCGAGIGLRRDGTFAEAVTAPRSAVIELPDGLPMDEAAAAGIAGAMAWRIVCRAGPLDHGNNALVLGAGGGVGLSVVSALAAGGATVWGQVGSRAKVEAVERAGAERVVVSGPETLADQLRTLRPNLVVDPLGGNFAAAAVEMLEPSGRLLTFGTLDGPQSTIDLRAVATKGLQICGCGGERRDHGQPQTEIVAALRAVASGAMSIVVGRRMRLDEVNAGMQELRDRRVTGRLVLEIGHGPSRDVTRCEREG